MPNHYDSTYAEHNRVPVFDSEKDQKIFERRRELNEILEPRAPGIPTQEMENEYMDFLAEDMRKDPWIHWRYHKYMAGPKRIPWRNSYEIKNDFKREWWTNFVIGGMLFWPFACAIGRRAKSTRGGVPTVPVNTFIHDHPNLDPTRYSFTTWLYYTLLSSGLAGYCFAHYFTDRKRMSNGFYNRPDLKPFPAMVPQDENDVTLQSMKSAHYQSYRLAEAKKDFYRSSFYRFFRPEQADWSIRANPYTGNNKHDVYSLEHPSASFGKNDFRSHYQN